MLEWVFTEAGRRTGDRILLAHVQIAGAPGRAEPGSGSLDREHELAVLQRLGHRGPLGLEYRPSGSTEASLQEISRLAAREVAA